MPRQTLSKNNNNRKEERAGISMSLQPKNRGMVPHYRTKPTNTKDDKVISRKLQLDSNINYIEKTRMSEKAISDGIGNDTREIRRENVTDSKKGHRHVY